MKLIKTTDAVGHVLCHDLTRIVKGVIKDAVFRKGHIITEEDIPVLLSMGKDHLYIWEKKEGMLHENEAAEILYNICKNDHMTPTPVKEGKIELVAAEDGLLKIDVERLNAINALGDIMIATRHSNFPVKKGDKIAGTRVVPLIIEKEKLDKAVELAGDKPLMEILPFKHKKAGVVTTGNEVFHGRIKDTFGPVVFQKLREYDAEILGQTICDDNPERISKAINDFIEAGADIICCTGGMSVDPDDTTPSAIKKSGAEIVSYGAPVLPGAMFLLAYHEKGHVPIVGLPGCVMYAKRTIFDLVLPRIMADETLTPHDLALLGHGGLCLNCTTCHFPNCGFGK
ncbi:MAG: molybdopterin-binding protein [Peptococcaceae bacterium]|nr:molybdopterin-binding protein [Peptococcaceae bacterium]MBQ3508717.1 molybdopterin-binding protein [Peptococcaceae bacterium]